jgi:shikimate dehydrogenase
MSTLFAVMGNPIEHSLSPFIHKLFAQQTGRTLTYQKIQIDLLQFEQRVKDFFDAGGCGLNITSPCKQRAFAMSKIASPRCLQAQAANTLWCDGKTIHADNTDGIGCLRDLSRYIDLTNKRILLLGAGGAARGILAPLLATNPAVFMIVNRTPDKALDLSLTFPPAMSATVDKLDEAFDLIINATSAHFANQYLTLPSSIITTHTLCYDLAYQQKGATPFVQWANDHGCIGMDGLGMLIEQAAESFFIWHGMMPETTSVRDVLMGQR